MTRGQYLPTALIVIQIVASAVWAMDGDWRQAVYWMGAAVVNAAVTY